MSNLFSNPSANPFWEVGANPHVVAHADMDLREDREFMLIPAAEVKRKVTPAKLKQMVISVGNLHPAAKKLGHAHDEDDDEA